MKILPRLWLFLGLASGLSLADPPASVCLLQTQGENGDRRTVRLVKE